jgi:hypothetical protein
MASQTEYQPAPWFHDGSRILNSSFRALGTVAFPSDARRIVACVNACEGLPTVVLEGGLIRRLVKRHVDELEEDVPGLKELLGSGPDH